MKIVAGAAYALTMLSGILLGSTQASAADYDYRGQCVPFARLVSGIDIRGNAHTWWSQAEGRYARGTAPRVGAVMVLKAFRSMPVGHVAVVSQLVDSRTIRITHANWSVINGRRGQVEENVVAVDASPNNDWSRVRVWYAPMGGVGLTSYPVAGFIYSDRAPRAEPVVTLASIAPGASEAKPSVLSVVTTLR